MKASTYPRGFFLFDMHVVDMGSKDVDLLFNIVEAFNDEGARGD